AALTVLFWGLRLWAGSGLYRPVNVLGCALTLVGLVACVAAWTLGGRPARIAQAALLAGWAVGFAGYALIFVTLLPGYGTDAMAFDQRAAELLTEGVNPYGVSLA